MNEKLRMRMLVLTDMLLEDIAIERELTTCNETIERMEATQGTVEELVKLIKEA
jgi:hypothetical protein